MSLLFVDISINVLTIQSSAIFSLSIFVVKFPATLEPPTCSRPFLFQSFLSRPVPLLHYPSYISVYFLSCCLLHLRFTPCFYHLFFSIIFYVHYLFKVSFLSLPDVVVFFQDCSSRIFYLLTLVHWYLVIIDSSASQCESFFFALLCRQPQFHTRLWMPLPCLCHFSFSWFICHLVSLDCILAPVCIPQLHIQCFTITITFPPSVPFYKIINPFFLVYQMLFPTPLWLFRFNTLLVPPPPVTCRAVRWLLLLPWLQKFICIAAHLVSSIVFSMSLFSSSLLLSLQTLYRLLCFVASLVPYSLAFFSVHYFCRCHILPESLHCHWCWWSFWILSSWESWLS